MDYIFFHILYSVSGFFFGVIACRYTILSFKNLLFTYANKSKAIALAAVLCLVITLVTWLGLPYFFYLRSMPALYIYCLSLVFFLALSYKKLRKH